MSLYWNAGDHSDYILKLVNRNVLDFVKWFWKEDGIVCWISDRTKYKGRMILEISSLPKPTKKDPSGNSDCYLTSVDLVDQIAEWANPYRDWPGPRSVDQKKDLAERLKAMREFRNQVDGFVKEQEEYLKTWASPSA